MKPPQLHTLSLHDALPISSRGQRCLVPGTIDDDDVRPVGQRESPAVRRDPHVREPVPSVNGVPDGKLDRKSTRLNSSHSQISYAVFCSTKKNDDNYTHMQS